MRSSWYVGLLLSLLLAVNNSLAKTDHHNEIDPEADTGFSEIKRSHSQHSMAVTANPHATAAANIMLSRGGSAVDAAIAAQLVLSLVEPQSSGIGGGAFMLHWNHGDQQLQLFDGRETAPSAVDENYFLNPDKKPMKFFDTLIGGYAVGAPGVVRMMALAHQQHGKLPWKTLFQPAIKLSREGFKLSPRLYALLNRFKQLLNHPTSRAYFYLHNGEPKAVNTLLKNPQYAMTLERLANQGGDSFYQGALAEAISRAVQEDPVHPGKLSVADIAGYQSLVRLPLCGQYRQYRVCTTPPPSSGATVLQILAILEQLPAPSPEPASSDWIHRFAEASKLAFADRDTYIADPAFVTVPAQAMIERDYLQQRAHLINLNKASGKALPGQPDSRLVREQVNSPEFPSTTHLSIIDAAGNAVSMTSSVQMAFGSGIMVGGFLLNNQLTDFSFVPRDGDQQLIANRIQAGKRPRSSMSPTMVFKEGKPVMLIGSPGGSRIIDYVARVIAYTLGADMDIAEAIASPNVADMNRKLELEKQRFPAGVIKQLQAMGHTVVEVDLNSGLHGIRIGKDGLTGAADPRREGVAAGQ